MGKKIEYKGIETVNCHLSNKQCTLINIISSDTNSEQSTQYGMPVPPVYVPPSLPGFGTLSFIRPCLFFDHALCVRPSTFLSTLYNVLEFSRREQKLSIPDCFSCWYFGTACSNRNVLQAFERETSFQRCIFNCLAYYLST